MCLSDIKEKRNGFVKDSEDGTYGCLELLPKPSSIMKVGKAGRMMQSPIGMIAVQRFNDSGKIHLKMSIYRIREKISR